MVICCEKCPGFQPKNVWPEMPKCAEMPMPRNERSPPKRTSAPVSARSLLSIKKVDALNTSCRKCPLIGDVLVPIFWYQLFACSIGSRAEIDPFASRIFQSLVRLGRAKDAAPEPARDK